eukprot:4363086-Pleurochrysis_carterae.AAC.1
MAVPSRASWSQPSERLHPLASPPCAGLGGCATAYAPRSTALSSGKTCVRLHSHPASVDARLAPARPPALQRLLARLRNGRQQHPPLAVRAPQAPGRGADVEAQSGHRVADQTIIKSFTSGP